MSRSAAAKDDIIAAITTFGDLLRYLRQRAQMTQRDLALATGYSISQISRLEHNQRLPDEMTLLAVFVPALGLEQELATVQQLLALARQARGEAAPPPAPPATIHEPVSPTAPPPTPKLTNLPHRLTSFLGREQEIVALQRLVNEQRLVTLTGVGGVGKSSLALAVANTLTFPDGVWLLELASLTEGSLVARTLAELFKLPEFPGRTPLEAVIAYLQHKELLLLVDNCEHLIATCADLIERLLQAASKLQIVATSREALNIAGEREWPVAPLPTPTHAPTNGAVWSLPQLQPFAAAQLFIERAQAAQADLIFADQDAGLIAHLCHQLDGIPLALELAAARCKSLVLAEIVARLHDRFALLSAGRRTALLRQQTLRATIDWSYDLLSPAEAALFRSLAVFVGGWTVDAAEQVANPGQSQPPTVDLLHQLVNKSLVVVDQSGETTRYRMLETIRQYAGEKLEEYGEVETTRSRHYAWCLALIENAAPTTLEGAPLDQWRTNIKADLDNVRTAFVWSQTQGDGGEKSLRLATAIGPYWQYQHDISEGSIWLESALAYTDQENSVLTSWGIAWLAFTLLLASPRAFDLATEAQQRFTVLDEPAGLALANLVAGIWFMGCGDSNKAIDCLQDALAWFEAKRALFFLDITYLNLANAFLLAEQRQQALHYCQLWFQLGEELDDYGIIAESLEGMVMIDPAQALVLCHDHIEKQRQRQNHVKVAELLHSLGIIWIHTGELAKALTALTECLALWQKLGVLWSPSGGTARACLVLGMVQYRRQEHQSVLAYAQKSVQLYQEAGDWHGVAQAHIVLGYSALATHDLTLALSSFHQCLHLAAARDLDCTYLAMVGLAEIARCQAKPALAASLFGAAERFAQHINLLDARWKEMLYRPLLTVAHTQLRDGAYAAAWVEGQTMPLDQAMHLALTFATSASSLIPLVSSAADSPGSYAHNGAGH
ncbi:MAG: helix-turn-helix domain-containing protein [Caldilineaceae bacterium]